MMMALYCVRGLPILATTISHRRRLYRALVSSYSTLSPSTLQVGNGNVVHITAKQTFGRDDKVLHIVRQGARPKVSWPRLSIMLLGATPDEG